jgi:hypothetical protein
VDFLTWAVAENITAEIKNKLNSILFIITIFITIAVYNYYARG